MDNTPFAAPGQRELAPSILKESPDTTMGGLLALHNRNDSLIPTQQTLKLRSQSTYSGLPLWKIPLGI
jgi:hypothetical protein